MEELNIVVLGIAEHWMLGQDRFKAKSGHTMVYSGKEEGRKRQGVGFILNKSAAKALMGYNPISHRIMTIRLRAHSLNLSIIQVYAPTLDWPEEESESFYKLLQETLDTIPARDMLLIMGEMNAKVGKRQHKSSHVGTHGLGKQNERGQILTEFCAGNDLVISNTCFKHPHHRLYTWTSPGDSVRNHIDYIFVKRPWRTSLINVKTRPQADCGSDHQLLTARVKIKLKVNTKKTRMVRYDAQSIPEAFTVEIRNRFMPILQYADEDCSPEDLWQEISSNMTKAVEKDVPRKKRIKQP